jgi:hypothetical protein
MAINGYLFYPCRPGEFDLKGETYEHNKKFHRSGGIPDLDRGFTVDRKHRLAEQIRSRRLI